MYNTFKNITAFFLALLIIGAANSAHAQSITDNELKRNIAPINSPLNSLLKLEPRMFEYETHRFKAAGLRSGKQYGFLADNIQEVFPHLVGSKQFSYMYGKNNYRQASFLTIDTESLVPILVASMQEMHREIEKLKQEINSLKSKSGS